MFDTYLVIASVFQEMLREQGKDVSYESILEAIKISAQTAYLKYKLDVLSGHEAGIDSCLIMERTPDQTATTYVLSDLKYLNGLFDLSSKKALKSWILMSNF